MVLTMASPNRMHPLSVGELARQTVAEDPIRPPQRIDPSALSDLLRFGGYPEPFLRAQTRFYNQGRRMRTSR